jgi:hypothetical protein
VIKLSAAFIAALAALSLTACNPADEPTAVQPAKTGAAASGKGAPKTVPIKLAAKRATADKSVLSQGGALSCARVTVTNRSTKNVEVNPLYFSLTDSGGTKHGLDSALGEYEGQIDTTTLAPDEKATGLVCGKGKWTPKVVALTNELFTEAARAEVA